MSENLISDSFNPATLSSLSMFSPQVSTPVSVGEGQRYGTTPQRALYDDNPLPRDRDFERALSRKMESLERRQRITEEEAPERPRDPDPPVARESRPPARNAEEGRTEQPASREEAPPSERDSRRAGREPRPDSPVRASARKEKASSPPQTEKQGESPEEAGPMDGKTQPVVTAPSAAVPSEKAAEPPAVQGPAEAGLLVPPSGEGKEPAAAGPKTGDESNLLTLLQGRERGAGREALLATPATPKQASPGSEMASPAEKPANPQVSAASVLTGQVATMGPDEPAGDGSADSQAKPQAAVPAPAIQPLLGKSVTQVLSNTEKGTIAETPSVVSTLPIPQKAVQGASPGSEPTAVAEMNPKSDSETAEPAPQAKDSGPAANAHATPRPAQPGLAAAGLGPVDLDAGGIQTVHQSGKAMGPLPQQAPKEAEVANDPTGGSPQEDHSRQKGDSGTSRLNHLEGIIPGKGQPTPVTPPVVTAGITGGADPAGALPKAPVAVASEAGPSAAPPQEVPLVEAAQTRAAPVKSVETPLDALAQNPEASVSKQIMESIHSSVQQGQRRLTITLHPAELGRVLVRLDESNGTLSGVLEVSQRQTRTEIEHALPGILHNLQGSGVQIRRLDVMLSNDPSHSGSRDLPWNDPSADSSDGQHGRQGRRNRPDAGPGSLGSTDERVVGDSGAFAAGYRQRPSGLGAGSASINLLM